MFQNIAAQTPGSPYFIPTGNATSNGSAVVSAYSCSTASTGSMTMSTNVSGVTQTITATVTTVGTYSIAATTNGVTFSGSGTFAGTGAQNVVLVATGIPTAAGSGITFTLNTTPSCSFTRDIISGTSSNGTSTISSFSCTTASAGTMTVGTPVTGVTQTITAQVTATGTYAIATTANGVTFADSGTFSGTGSQNIVLTATGTPTTSGGAVSFTLNTAPNCSFSRAILDTSTNGTAVVSSYSCSTASTGTLIAGTAVSGVTQTVTAQVTTAGTYSITTTANGVTFAGSGTFSGTGAQKIVLTATGTPTAIGTAFSFPLNTSPSCSFSRSVISTTSNGTALVSSYSCATASAGTMTMGKTISGVTQTITAQVTTVGTYSISTTANGVTFSGSGTFTGTGAQNIVLTATGTPTASGTGFTFTLNTTPTCSFTRVIFDSSSNGTAVVSAFSCSTGSTGSLYVGSAVTNVTQTITATVTTVGTYSISILNNGVTFAASGTFTVTGVQNIVLTATGTPTAAGTFSYTLNTTPNCNFSRTATVIAVLPANLTLSAVSNYFIASAFDQDYLPYVAPTSAGELPSGSVSEVANGSNEATTINVQGTLNTTGITIKIPYTATASISLPAFSQTITIPAPYTEDGISRDITFSYNAATLSSGSGTISATLKAVAGNLNVKKLDLQSGMGNDYLGVFLGQFTYSTNSSGGTANFQFRAVPGILDKRFSLPDNNGNNQTHNMLYFLITAGDGKIWLNNNLGAKYSDVTNANFNPTQQATSATDYNAYGSLFQQGRSPDGHELINWTSSTAGTSLYGTTTILYDTPPIPFFIYGNVNWRSTNNDTYWITETNSNNPCPVGFRVPSSTEFNNLVSSSSITNSATGFSSVMKFTTPGYRDGSNAALTSLGGVGQYWTSSASISHLLNSTRTSNRSNGHAVRCIKD